MAHLRKSAATGHLLKNSAGHLINACPTTTTAPPTTTPPPTTTGPPTTTPPPGTTTEGPQNECNSCDPPIPDTLYVTCSGLGGDLGFFNGKHQVLWDSGCLWTAYRPLKDMSLHYLEGLGIWEVHVATTGFCYKTWDGPSAPCDPTGNYSEAACQDTDCAYPDTCEVSEGATCSVSYA